MRGDGYDARGSGDGEHVADEILVAEEDMGKGGRLKANPLLRGEAAETKRRWGAGRGEGEDEDALVDGIAVREMCTREVVSSIAEAAVARRLSEKALR